MRAAFPIAGPGRFHVGEVDGAWALRSPERLPSYVHRAFVEVRRWCDRGDRDLHARRRRRRARNASPMPTSSRR